MTASAYRADHPFNPDTDLEINRLMTAPPDKIWRAWTTPALLEQWFAPKPVVVSDAVINLHPGGQFSTTMDVPGHGKMANMGCILQVVPERVLVFTDLLGPGFAPITGGFGFTGVLLLAAEGTGTRYIARALHGTADGRAAHEAMGFHEGWGKAGDQLDALAQTL